MNLIKYWYAYSFQLKNLLLVIGRLTATSVQLSLGRSTTIIQPHLASPGIQFLILHNISMSLKV